MPAETMPGPGRERPIAELTVRDGLAWCWLVWALKPGEALLVAIATSEDVADRYKGLVDKHYPGSVFHVEEAPVDHVFGDEDLRAVAFRAARKWSERRQALSSRPAPLSPARAAETGGRG